MKAVANRDRVTLSNNAGSKRVTMPVKNARKLIDRLEAAIAEAEGFVPEDTSHVEAVHAALRASAGRGLNRRARAQAISAHLRASGN